METKKNLNAPKEEGKKLRELTEEELAQVNGGMNIGKVPPIEGLSSLSLPDMVAELEKHGLAGLGGAVAIPGGGASHLTNEGLMGIDPKSEAVANPFTLFDNDLHHLN